MKGIHEVDQWIHEVDQWIHKVDLKISWGGSQDSSLKPYNQVVKVGEEPLYLSSCWVAK